MPMSHVPEIGAENPYHKTDTVNRHENRALSSSLPKTGSRKFRHRIACQTRQKPVPVFGADFWYVCHWPYARYQVVRMVYRYRCVWSSWHRDANKGDRHGLAVVSFSLRDNRVTIIATD